MDNKAKNIFKKLKPGQQKVEAKILPHEWDGIREYDNSDPLWLRYTFYAAILFSLIYWLLYPSWPTPSNRGLLNWTPEKHLAKQLEELKHLRSEYQEVFDAASFEEILSDPKLYKFAVAGGESAFNNHCAVCHQQGGSGAKGYPNLTDDNWIWGGKIDDIYQTLLYGIRSGHEEARDSQMAAFGKDGLLTQQEIAALSRYVHGMYGHADQTEDAAKLFTENCASCHGDMGQGGRDFGAPALNSPIWLYGGDLDTIYDVIYNGRAGVMPYWNGRLDDATIRQLAVYVHQLGGGE